jgi:hypothetical protein
MKILSAAEARAMTNTRKQQIEEIVDRWRARFNDAIRRAANGSDNKASQSFAFFSIDAITGLALEARDVFVAEIKSENYKVTLHDSNDDNDYFCYRIDWS